jgi:hypothetical protein
MILNEGQVDAIVSALSLPTQEGKLPWRADGSQVWLFLPPPSGMIIQLEQMPSSHDVTAKVLDENSTVLGSRLYPNLTQQPLIRELFNNAKQQAGKSIVASILESISASESFSAQISRKIDPKAIASVFAKMKGRWHLDFSRGDETAVIDAEGHYVTEGRRARHLQLRVIAFTSLDNPVEIAKDRPDGSCLQIEYLTIGDNEMGGHAKHDGHRLLYKRIAHRA